MASKNLSMMVRNFSTSKVVDQLVKPPIQVFGVNGRYATALYSAATKKKNVEAVEKELLKFQSLMKTDTNLKEFMLNPTINSALKTEAIKSTAGKLSFCESSSNFLQLIAENNRLKNLNAVINAFKTIMSAHRGEVVCEVTVARPLDAGQSQKLQGVLKSFLKSNESLTLETKVDPSIIGGMIVSIGDRYVDMSTANKIKMYTDIINTPI